MNPDTVFDFKDNKVIIMNDKKTLIIVTGGPGTGKSFTASRIAEEFPSLCVLSYDKIKEKDWDLFGFDNAADKARINAFSLEEFYLTLQKMMWEGSDILIEYPFSHRHRDRLWELIHRYDYQAVTVLLEADWKVVYDRFSGRSSKPARHPGHQTNHYHIEELAPSADKRASGHAGQVLPDAVPSFREFMDDINAKIYDIRLGETIRLNVTDFSTVSYPDLFHRIRAITTSGGTDGR